MNEPPEKIYLQWNPENEESDFDIGYDVVTWCADKINDNDPGYILMDVHEGINRTPSDLVELVREFRSLVGNLIIEDDFDKHDVGMILEKTKDFS